MDALEDPTFQVDALSQLTKCTIQPVDKLVFISIVFTHAVFTQFELSDGKLH